jgi:Ni,Fe-hydrogenase III small subunit/NAD-dependent dihydropyrimidine dehydrogenase PreA subunit
MLNILKARWRQGYRTFPYPQKEPVLPDRLRGLPVLNDARCQEGCKQCEEVCPTEAIQVKDRKITLDMGRCLFCGDCQTECLTEAIRFTTDYRLAADKRKDLVLGEKEYQAARGLDAAAKRLFGRSLKLRQVSAAGCNACEADVNVLNTLVFDLGRFGIQFVASPRHADGLLITGPVSRNMELALKKTYDAVPSPKIVIAVGACAISGGPYIGHAEANNGAGALLPVDLFIPGCPPHPMTILDGLLRLLGRLESGAECSSRDKSNGSQRGKKI